MFDFLMISTRSTKRGTIEIYPKFLVKKSKDLMIRGGDFYAIWNEEKGLWTTDQYEAICLIDHEVDIYEEQHRSDFSDTNIKVLHLWDSTSGMIDSWRKYCQKQLPDCYHMLDEKLIFSNTEVSKKDYASKRLNYPLESGECKAWNKLISTLYSEEERHKIEWAIGSIVSGESKHIQKFMVFYGAAGTGKSTILNIIQQLFEGYFSVFDAKALGSSNSSFALEAFRTNPLVAIQHDGDLSRIEDNTRLNSLVSHEIMTVNEKFKSQYSSQFKCFLFMGTNKPVKITDAKSGLIRRLIDVTPSGNKLSQKEYNVIIKNIAFELGAIAWHCKEVYLEDPLVYDNYTPLAMMETTNDFYNFVLDSFFIFEKEDGTSLKAAWEMYKQYCDDSKMTYTLNKRVFKEELKNYFTDFEDRYVKDGERIRSYYSGFKADIFEHKQSTEPNNSYQIEFNSTTSILDELFADCQAQEANEEGKPPQKWVNVTTKLSDIDTTKVHYVRPPNENYIFIDFDLTDEDGNKSFEKNLIEASKWPPTYAELSKSGDGIHLHYIYNGDVSKLDRIYSEHIEVKVCTGNSSIRRKLSKCNTLPITSISSGLPLKGEKKMVDESVIKTELGLRTLIKRNLAKDIHNSTKCSIDFIYKILDEVYNSELVYDVTDLRNAVLAFAANSTHNSEYCVKLVSKMKFKSENVSENKENKHTALIFYDVEVFPNLFLLNWKVEGEGQPVIRLINPTPSQIEDLLQYRLVGFNCRRYDNHITYARLLGYLNEDLFRLSQRIIDTKKGEYKNCFFSEAYNLSYTDVYDFCSKKQSLKKWEIELGIHHQELGLPWDQPVPENMWKTVAEYCDNDVLATEAVFNARKSDFLARQILADVAGMTVNDTTNSLTTRIIFGKEKHPNLNYRFMGSIPDKVTYKQLPGTTDENAYFCMFDCFNRPIFPGYKFEKGISTYRDEEVGEGGYVYSEPGMYRDVALLDISSMHPSSIRAENLFGEHTKYFNDILDARIAIKHKEFDKAAKMLDGKLEKYLTDPDKAKDLAQALKIAINSVYGLTSARFDNPFRDIRNVDNIVAKRGALFMINLKHEVQARGYIVAHIKTDSIKIPNATPEIINFVMDYGKLYGYNFEHEATYDRMCLVNDAVYIAKDASDGHWTATGTQFQIPYVFKTLFSKEEVKFSDLCETKSVSTEMYLDMNEGMKEGEHNYIFVGKVGNFCPIKEGKGGGLLLRKKEDKYDAVVGTKGYRWMEAENVRIKNMEDDIDISYYTTLATNAVNDISKYGDFEWFAEE